MARLALSIAGGILGAIFIPGVGASLGFALGSAAGGILASLVIPQKGTHVYGPRVNDLNLSTATPGSVIPLLWGKMRLGGQIIAGSKLQEVTNTTSQSAKGGPSVSQTTYTYFVSFAAAFCQGPATITRIWGDTKLIYDSTGTGQLAKNLTVVPKLYQGTMTQTADPTLVAVSGANNTPGYRGICYAVWNKFPLADFGNRLPNIRAEVSAETAAAVPQARIPLDGFNSTPHVSGHDLPAQYVKISPDGLTAFAFNGNGPVVNHPGVVRIDLSTNTIVAEGVLDASPINPVHTEVISGITYTSIIDTNQTGAGGAYCIDSNNDIWVGCYDQSAQPFLVCFDGWSFKAKRYTKNTAPDIDSNINQIRRVCYSTPASMTLYADPNTGDYITFGNFYSEASGYSFNGYVVGTVRCSDATVVGQYPYMTVDQIHSDDAFTEAVVDQLNPVVDTKGNFYFLYRGFHDDVHTSHYTTYDWYIVRVHMPGGVSNFTDPPQIYTSARRFSYTGDATVGVPNGMVYNKADDTLICYTDTGAFIKIDCDSIKNPDPDEPSGDTGDEMHILQIVGGTGNPQFAIGNNQFSPHVGGGVVAQNMQAQNNVLWAPYLGDSGTTLAKFDASTLEYLGHYSIYDFPHLAGNPQILGYAFDARNNSIIFGDSTTQLDLGAGYPLQILRDYFDRLSTTGVSVDQIVKQICEMAGIADENIDVSQIASLTVEGYPVVQLQPGKDMINILAQCAFFEGRETDFKLQFIPRGSSSIATFQNEELGMEADKCTVTELLGQESDRPKEVEILYTDPALDYQQSKQHKVRHHRTKKTRNITSISTPVVMTAAVAAQLADKILWLSEAEARTYKTSSYKASIMLFDPCDVVDIVTDDGAQLTTRITAATVGQNFATALELSSEDSNNYQSNAAGNNDTGFVAQTLAGLVNTVWWLLDTPYLSDSDVDSSGNSGYYFAGDPLASGNWRGFALYSSSDATQYNQVGSAVDKISYGVAQNILPAPRSPWVWDDVNTLTVKMIQGTGPASDADLNVLNGTNAAILYPSLEVIQFGTATLNSDGSYTLSHLLRGRRGTEWASGTAGLGEKILFPLVQGGIHRNPAATSLVNSLRYMKAITLGMDANSAQQVQSIKLQGNDLKPYAPVQITGNLSGSDWTLGWVRRTRFSGDWKDGDGTGSPDYNGMAVPLNEDGQAYYVEITDSTGVVKRTKTVTSNRFSYTSAMQTADFGSDQTTVYINVYQFSAIVGIGFKGSAVINTSRALPAVDTAPAMTNIPGTTSGGGFLVNGA